MVTPVGPGPRAIQRSPGWPSISMAPRNCSICFPRRRAPRAKAGVRCRMSVPLLVLVGQATGIDVISKVDEAGLGVHAEGRSDELGVQGVDELDEAGAADHPGRIAAVVKDVG